jgi:hypothetical protein
MRNSVRDSVVEVSVLWVSRQEILDLKLLDLKILGLKILGLKVLIPAAAGPSSWSQESAGRKILTPGVGVRKAVKWVVLVPRASPRAVLGLRALFPEGLKRQARVRLAGRSRVLGRRILVLRRVCLGVCARRAAGPPAWAAGPARGQRALSPE